MLQDFGFQRRTNVAEAFQLGARFHYDIFGDAKSSQTAMRPLRPADRGLVTVADDDQEIEIATFVGPASSMGAEQPDLFWLKLGGEAASDLVKRVLAECFHIGPAPASRPQECTR